jgi:hypothetical protein
LSIVEKIPLFGARPTTEYRFTIRDTYTCDSDPTQTCGDGICCNYGNGQYKLFANCVTTSAGAAMATNAHILLTNTLYSTLYCIASYAEMGF